MKFVANTISKPVTGKEATKLIKAIKNDQHVANEQAMQTIKQIIDRRANQKNK